MGKKLSVVVLGGGSGGFTLLDGLKHFSGLFDLTSVFTIADDGGSSGLLRSEYGILPPGDLRRHIAALSESPEMMIKLLNFRFDEGSLQAHSLGNLIYAALVKITGSDEEAIKHMSELFKTGQQVLPASLDKVHLVAEYAGGKTILGESNIDRKKGVLLGPIKRVYLVPSAQAYPRAVKAIREATHIILSPGDLYTSILPILLVQGICEAIRDSSAKIIYLVNLMDKVGETEGFTAEDFVKVLHHYLKYRSLDYVFVNNKIPSSNILEAYAGEGSHLVPYTVSALKDLGVSVIEADLLYENNIIRHHSDKTALEIVKMLLSSLP